MPGVLELLPAEQILFQRMLESIRRVFERYGFVPVETPAIELTDVLLTKSGGDTEREVFFVQSSGSRQQGRQPDQALRFDLTVPLARYVAEHEHDLSFPFRRYQIQRVYRGERPQRGRFREFYQCDIDVIDRNRLDVRHDAEVAAVMAEVFGNLEIGSFTMRLNNRRMMRAIFDVLGVDPEVVGEVLREVDKLEKLGAARVAELVAGHGVGTEAIHRLLDLAQIRANGHGPSMVALDGIESLIGNDDGLVELRTVIDAMRLLGVPDDVYGVDLSIARGLDYYTGTVYETTLDDHPDLGSVCSGGRYDDLDGHYTSTRLPGVGLSIGLTRLFWQLRDAGILQSDDRRHRSWLVTLMDEEGLAYALDIGARLRAAGCATENVMSPSKLGKQLKRADQTGIRFAVIAGDEERGAGTVTVKDLQTQRQVTVPLSEVPHGIAFDEET